MNLDFIGIIEGMLIPVVVIACLICGYIVKHWIKDVDNKYIPTIVVILGGVLACIVTKDVSVEVITAGCCSGLISTGAHQLLKQYLDHEW